MGWKKGKLRPDKWVSQDPVVRKKNLAFLRMRCQAKFRGEEWTLTFEEFQAHWVDKFWIMRGYHRNAPCMTRIDETQPWSNSNVMIVPRLTVLHRTREKNKKEK